MFRYLAILWNDQIAAQTCHARELSEQLQSPRAGWHSVCDEAGVLVYCRGSDPNFLTTYALPDRGGVILGRLFGTSRTDPMTSVAAAAHEIRARILIERSWGQYVAFLRDPEARVVRILRDPSGAMRCFFARHRDLYVFCSNAEDGAALGIPFSANWNYIVAELTNQAAMGWDQTGLSELSAVRAGECVEVSASGARRRTCWDPIGLARAPISNANEAAHELRRTVRACVQAWAACHRHIALLLSGGLDSSVILNCLRDLDPRPAISCLNYFHHGSRRADERSYARLAARHAGCELVEVERATDVRLEALLDLPKSARPSHNGLDHVLHRVRSAEWAKREGAAAVITGDFGDQLFCQQLAGYATIDTAWRGSVVDIVKVAARCARAKETSIWRFLLPGLGYGMLTRGRRLRGLAIRFERRNESNPYLERRALRHFEHRLQERWVRSVRDLPLGKLYHIASIASGQAYLTPVGDDDDPEWITPLNSQPIIELCLRLPISSFVRHGRDRAVLRDAFSRDLPAEIVRRRSKGTTSTQRAAVYSANREFLRRLLLDGILASQGLLDKRMVARDLDAEDYRRNIWLERCIAAETWLRIWMGERKSLGASH